MRSSWAANFELIRLTEPAIHEGAAMIQFFCEWCGKQYNVTNELAGKRATCKGCSRIIVVPDVQADCVRIETSDTSSLGSVTKGKLILAAIMFAIVGVVRLYTWITGNTTQPAPAHPGTPVATGVAPFIAPTSAVPVPNFPDRPTSQLIDNEVVTFPMIITGAGPVFPTSVRLYLPAKMHAPRTLPCLLIAAGESRLRAGVSSGSADDSEYLRYARAGFAVLAYEMTGASIDDNGTWNAGAGQGGPLRRFIGAGGGLANARIAVDFVLAKVPEVDPARLYAEGHHFGGTMALCAAANDNRLAAVAARAPICDMLFKNIGDLSQLEAAAPGTRAAIARLSPARYVTAFVCPLFVYEEDDERNPFVVASNIKFEMDLQAEKKSAVFVHSRVGGAGAMPYMAGISDTISFFESIGAKPSPVRNAEKFAVNRQSLPTMPPTTKVSGSTNQPGLAPQPKRSTQVEQTPELAPPDGGPEWAADALLSKKLGPEVEIDGYVVRLPQGFVQRPAGNPVKRPFTVWANPNIPLQWIGVRIEKRPAQGSYPHFRSACLGVPPGIQVTSLLKATKEYGRISGMRFIRAEGLSAKYPIFLYTAHDAEHWISICGFANSDQATKLLHAAAQTIRLKK